MLVAAAALALVAFNRATCGVKKNVEINPVQKAWFEDYVYFHNVGITWDGTYYYTINGGNEDYCRLNKLDKSGDEVEGYDVDVDGRSIFYNPRDGRLYVKVYGTELYVVDLDDEDASERLDCFEEDNSSVAFAPDGKRMYELVTGGTVRVLDFDSGDELKRFKLEDLDGEELSGPALAASDKYLFVSNDDADIFVYDLKGRPVTRFSLPQAGLALSLSWTRDMLWIAEDADASTDGGYGIWYGYRLDGLR